MQTKKMSLATIQGKLSRTEMKKIMAGSGAGCIGIMTCRTDSDCTVPESNCKCKDGQCL